MIGRYLAILTLSLFGGADILAPFAHAELILDDFDDPAISISPEMENDIIATPSVGGLQAERQIRIAAAAANPSANLNADTTTASVLNANLSALNPTDMGGALFAFQFDYFFAPTDISEGGANNAIILDFRSTHGNGFTPALGLIVRDDSDLTETYFAEIANLPLTSGPFTVSLPFSSFTQRGGAPGLPDFTTVKRMDFDFFFQFPPNDVLWSAELERIRIGRVPEPNSLALLLLSAIILVCVNRSGVVSHLQGGSYDVPSICGMRHCIGRGPG